MQVTRFGPLVGALFLAACAPASDGASGGGSYGALFAPPSNPKATPGAILGLWSGSIDSADLRMKLEPTKLAVAVRCGEVTAGVAVAAEVSEASIKTLESGTAIAGPCTVRVSPTTVKGCAKAGDMECFAIDATKLRLRVDVFTLEQDVPAERGQGPSPGQIPFTKLAD